MEETSDVSKHYYIYVLISLKDRRLYIGFTSNLKLRLIEHAQGKVTATKSRRFLKLIYYEYFLNVRDAKARERFLKSGFGRNQLKLALKDTLEKYNYRFK